MTAARRTLAPALALLLAAAGCGRGEASAQAADPRRAAAGRAYPVRTEPAREGVLGLTLEETGGLEAEAWVEVTAPVEGVLGPPLFREGDPADPEKPLFEIDPERYRLAHERAAAAVLRFDAQLRDQEATLERIKRAAAKVPGSVVEIDVLHQEALVDEARAALAEARVLRDLAARDLEHARVRPPIRGVIDRRCAMAGQYVRPGALLAVVVQPRPLRLRFSLREEDATRVAPGARVALSVPAYGGEAFAAEVFHVAAAADASSRRVEVLAAVANEDGRLKPGFFAKIVVGEPAPARAVVLPESAVLKTEDGHVAYVVAEGRARKRVLEVGRQGLDGRFEVRRGVTAGEPVVVEGAASLADGVEVSER
jgi:RND family efflux transporter MFP subunit